VGTVASLSVKISANVSDFDKGIQTMQRSLDQAGSKFQSIGSKLTAGISLPLAAAAGVATKFAADFETSTTKLVTLSGVSEQQMKKMRQAVLDLAPTVGIGPNALSEALLVVTSTGFEGAQAMEILATAAKSSAVGMGDTKDVARALTAAISAYGSENLSAARAGDILHATVVAGGAEATELAGEIGRVVGVAANLGVSFEEVGAFIATYTRLGISAAEATTGLSGVLNTILAPSKEAKDALKDIGLSADQLRQSVADQGLGASLGMLLEKLDGNSEATGALFGNVRALAGVLGTAGVQGAGYAETLEQIRGSNGNLNAAFEETKKTFGFQWNEFKAQAEKLAITLGTQLLPALTGLLQAAKPLGEWLAKAISWFAQLPQPVQTAALGVLGLLAALGPVAYAIGTVLKAGSGILQLVQWVGGLGGAAGLMQGAWTGAISVFEVVASIVGGLVTVFGGWAVLLGGAVVAGVVALGLKTGVLQSVFSGLWDVIGGTVTVFMDLATIIGKGVIEVVSELWDWVSNLSVWSSLGEMLQSTRQWFADLIPDFLTSLLSSVVEKVRELAGYLHLLAGAGFGGPGKSPKTPDAPGMFKGTTSADLLAGPKNVDDFAISGTLQHAAAIKQTKEEIAKAKREAEAWAKENDKITGRAAIKDAEEWMKRLGQIGGVTKLSSKANEELTTSLDAALEAYRRLGPAAGVASAAMIALWAGQQKASPTFITALGDAAMQSAEKMRWAKDQVAPTVGRLGMPNDTGPQLMLPDLPGIVPELSLATMTINKDAIQKAKLTVTPFREAFNQLGRDLPNMIFGALQNGGNVLGTIASGMGAQFAKSYQAAYDKALEKAGGDASKVQLTAGTKALGIGSVGISSAFTGYDLGAKLGKGKGALAGAGAGAAAGVPLAAATGGLSIAVGAGIGALAGFFGGRKKDKEAKAQMEEQRAEILKQYGGMDKLKSMADSLGVSLGNAFSTKKPEEFRAAIEKLNVAVEAHKIKVEGLSEIASGVNARGQAFSASLKATGATPGSEGEFNRVGAMALGGLGASMASGAGLLESLTQLQPVLGALNQAQAEFNFTGSEVTQRLLEMNAAVQANLPTFQALTADGQILNGMIKANWADFGLFAATTADVTAKVGELTAGGMSLNQAMSLNQPVLQALWQAQQQFGFATDEATQALIDQAVTNGIVGPQMKSTQDQMLDVLKAIATVLGADIPAALAGLPGAAQSAANGMSDAFGQVELPGGNGGWGNYNPNYQDPNSPNYVPPDGGANVSNPDIPALAAGGLVNRKTLAWIGEAGPEVVVPLSDFAGMLGAGVSPLPMDDMRARAVQAMDAAKAAADAGLMTAYNGAGRKPSGDGYDSSGINPGGMYTPGVPVVDAPRDNQWLRDRMRTGGKGTTVIFEEDGRTKAEYLLPFIADETTRLRLNG
jgi:TP901 family phage tail tape measure protein